MVNERDTQYLLLTPGPLSTTRTVREAMMQEHSTWDIDYNSIVESIRSRLVRLAVRDDTNLDAHTAALMPGSGTFAVESVIGSVIPSDGKLLVLNNGAYGARITTISRMLGIDTVELAQAEIESTDLGQVEQMLANDPGITHVAMVHCETTTGMLNPVEAVGEIVHRHGREFILDAMSSFGGIPMRMESIGAQYLISSANKCVQGVPGFGFVVADRATLEATKGRARSHSLDLFGQWHEMETKGGKWRFTSPTHVVSAFAQALDELEAEGGVDARHARYVANQKTMVDGMRAIGFRTLIGDEVQSPIITSFYFPEAAEFEFQTFYDALKARGFVIYPGKVSHAQCFRIGSIGDVHPSDMTELIGHVSEVISEMGVRF
ncbi:MAG: 2-aminoethylphosphonate--pyruvate transaminase [Verrucomicrobia bacterium]|nr:2-aminoethylphosphonate--pyruvate transaminase [Verrucomicrobiota bacterium]MBT3912227.1 2-aminoethylphosphonate--pyruvate transaminase [Verrucomicrobiota bacterium]MBT5310556.1 2-aminoethylphosphonate--pyruvate transaminase [Verrucomicrobiota bacterium]MBT5620145.1 2-aminoethylphosphonate--pyruvate transaminase [Verrucomicrobiota bacterium]MBT6661058.1 2-aminoethylphosphonate--pyruvate transaminase [Verrucomicrobiota bacterium]